MLSQQDYLLFHEYFHPEEGRGVGACHQGWTLLVTRCLDMLADGHSAIKTVAVGVE